MFLSELCGANRAFNGFLEFNPFNVKFYNINVNGLDLRILDEA